MAEKYDQGAILCEMLQELRQIRRLNETWEKRETEPIFITIPESGSTSGRSYSSGTTKIDFRTGVITNPDGTLEQLKTKLNNYQLLWMHSLTIDSDQDIVIKMDGIPKEPVRANFIKQIPYVTYYLLEITCTVTSYINLFACTNPAAIIGTFKGLDKLKTKYLGISNVSGGTDTLTPTSGKKIRLWTFIFELSCNATFDASGDVCYLYFGTDNTNTSKILWKGGIPGGAGLAERDSFTLAAPRVGEINEVLTLKNAIYTNGGHWLRTVSYYDEID